MLSTESSGTTRSLPSSIACGAAAFRLDVKNAVVVPDSVMPSGVKMRFFTKSSQFWPATAGKISRSEEHTSELQSRLHLVCRLLLEKKKWQSPLTDPNSKSVFTAPTALIWP